MDYTGPIEAALTTDLRGEPYNFSLWDIYTGTQIVVFKGNKSNPIPKCLQFIDNNYFITATDNVLQVWSIFNRKCQEQKIFLPNRPSTMCISPCGKYLVAGISEMIYVWQMNSGNLMGHAQRHYQTVSVLKMNQDGTFLFSGGEDGVTLVWTFADLISRTHNTKALNLSDRSGQNAGINEPRFVWQHHSSQVTDIHVTNGGRCITVSVDATLNIYNYVSGNRIYCVTMPSPLWSVVMNRNETRLFLGAQDGNIYEIAVSSLSLSLMNSQKDDGSMDQKPLFVGHKGKIVNLVISTDGSRLISASIDSSCKIWDLQHRKMLQDIKHQAPLANLTSLIVPNALALASMTQVNSKAQLSLRPLKRNMYKQPREGTLMGTDLFEENSTTIVYTKNNGQSDWESHITDKSDNSSNSLENMSTIMALQRQQNGTSDPALVNSSDGESVQNLKEKIKDLYFLSAEKIFQDAASESLQPFKSIIDDIVKVNKLALTNGKKSTKKSKKPANSQPVKKSKRN